MTPTVHLIFDLNIIFGIQVQKFCFPLLHTIYLQRYMDEYENGTLLATSHCGNLLHTWLETCILDLCCKKLWDDTAPLVLHKSEKYSLCPIILSFEYFGDFRFNIQRQMFYTSQVCPGVWVYCTLSLFSANGARQFKFLDKVAEVGAISINHR